MSICLALPDHAITLHPCQDGSANERQGAEQRAGAPLAGFAARQLRRGLRSVQRPLPLLGDGHHRLDALRHARILSRVQGCRQRVVGGFHAARIEAGLLQPDQDLVELPRQRVVVYSHAQPPRQRVPW